MGSNQSNSKNLHNSTKTGSKSFMHDEKSSCTRTPETFGDMCKFLGIEAENNTLNKDQRYIPPTKYNKIKTEVIMKPSESNAPNLEVNLPKIKELMKSFNIDETGIKIL